MSVKLRKFHGCRILAIWVVMLSLTACGTYRMQCEAPTISEELIQPLPPLAVPTSLDCGEILDTFRENTAVCAVWGARYRRLVEAVE